MKLKLYNCKYPCLINMKVLNSNDFMKKYNLKNDTMNETQLQRVHNYPIYPKILKYIQLEDLLI